MPAPTNFEGTKVILKDTVTTLPVTLQITSGTLTGADAVPADGTITDPKLAVNAVTNTKIANSAVSDSKISGVDGSKITDSTVTNAKIVSVAAAKITSPPWLTGIGDMSVAPRQTWATGVDILIDGSFEAWNSDSDLTNWTEILTGTGTVSRAGVGKPTTKRMHGSFSASLNGGGGANHAAIEQTLSGTDIAIPGAGVYVVAKGYYNAISGGQAPELKLTDGSTTNTTSGSPLGSYWSPMSNIMSHTSGNLTINIKENSVAAAQILIDGVSVEIFG